MDKTKLLTEKQIQDIIDKTNTEVKELLKDTNYNGCVFQTSEYYEDCEETDIYYDHPMFEASIETKDTEEYIDKYDFGRYCDVNSCIEELYGAVNEILNNKYCTN